MSDEGKSKNRGVVVSGGRRSLDDLLADAQLRIGRYSPAEAFNAAD